ncbi:MAG: hypothetical protein ACFFED_02770 [Candidatus Thorarchaeota archaeon]
MKELTDGSISEVKDGRILIEPHMKSAGISNGSDVLIIRSRSGFLRVIPLESEFTTQVRVSLDLNAFTQASRLVYEKIRKSEIKLLHSTGFCPMEDSCIWEGYFNISKKDNIEEFVEWLRAMDVVLAVELIYLTKNE